MEHETTKEQIMKVIEKIETKEVKTTMYRCDFCDGDYKSRHDIVNHIINDHIEKIQIYIDQYYSAYFLDELWLLEILCEKRGRWSPKRDAANTWEGPGYYLVSDNGICFAENKILDKTEEAISLLKYIKEAKKTLRISTKKGDSK